MKKFNSKIVVGAALALSLGGFTIPASASVPPPQSTKYVARKVGGIQLAQLARDVDEKADEVHNGATGAVNAVDAAHRRHERVRQSAAESAVRAGRRKTAVVRSGWSAVFDRYPPAIGLNRTHHRRSQLAGWIEKVGSVA